MSIRTINSLEQWQSIALTQRPLWFIPEDIATVYPITDNGEELVSLQQVCQTFGCNMVFAPVFPEYTNNTLFLRESVAGKLIEAQQILHKKYATQLQFKIYDAFRPLSVQRTLFSQIEQEIKVKEGLSARALWERVTQFIADPNLCPPHSTGGAVDLTIVDTTTGAELDMGTTVDCIDSKSHTWSEAITDTQRDNRQILFDVLTGVGFVNLATEWWHYSLGDQYWAIFMDQPAALYESIDAIPV